MKVVIIDYGSGNLRSAAKAFERAAQDNGLSAEVVVSDDPDALKSADRVVLPGVGAFGDCRAGLMAVPGLKEALSEAVLSDGKPFFGICVGMQLLADQGLEHGTYDGLGWISGKVEALAPNDPGLKIPHMGWNGLEIKKSHPVLDGLSADAHAYFVHSYAYTVADPEQVLATVDYGGPVTAVIGRDNMVGSQFHPEKSQQVGLKIIGNFLKWNP